MVCSAKYIIAKEGSTMLLFAARPGEIDVAG